MATPQQEADRFAAELLWCINQLEMGLKTQTPSSRQAQEAMKMLKILRSTKAPMVKKRQAMRNAFGDYRKKMKDGEKKSLNAMKHSRFQNSANCRGHSKSRFLRQSHTKQGVHSQDADSAEWTSLDSDLSQLSLVAESVSPQREERVINDSSTSDTGKSSIPEDQGILSTNSEKPPVSEDKGKTLFKVIPSDNSFVFSFKNGESESDTAEILHRAMDSEPLNTTTSVVNVNNRSTDNVKLHKNFYKYQKSDNEFSFNFDTAE